MKHLKVYIVTVLMAIFFAVLPWGLEKVDILEIGDTLFIYSWLSASLGMIISFFYIIKRIQLWKTRLIIFFLNPVLYYLLIIIIIIITLMFFTNWDRLWEINPAVNL